ncbi:DUF4192 domain-containing protein [Lentzea tibetensis]|nr:DUF4192 domain-containing protein [Lentzea tibetensis]
MTTPLLPPLRVLAPEDLIASVPHILGFHPDDSLVVMAMHEHNLTFTMRVDLPLARHRRPLAEQLLIPIREHQPTSVLLLVFGGVGTADPPEELPHKKLIDVLDDAVDSIGVAVAHAVWVQSCQTGAPWYCYDDIDCGGTMPDPSSSPVAAASAAAGIVTFSNRAEMAALVAPAPDDVLARRSALLDEAVEEQRIATAAGIRLVRDAVGEFPSRTNPLTDDEIVRLLMALSDDRVRDASLSFSIGPTSAAAEHLWLEMTRGCPAPERADPATLLAFTAYLRGDGGLASVALHAAETACPGHRLAGLLRHALDCGLAPARIRALAQGAAQEAAWHLAAGAQQ